MHRQLTDDDLDVLLENSTCDSVSASRRPPPLWDISNRAPYMSQDDDMCLLLGPSASTSASTAKGIEIAQLPWNARNSDRETIREAFEEQLQWEISRAPDLRSALEPFSSRGAFSTRQRQRQLHPHVPQPLPPLPGHELRGYQATGVEYLLRAFSRGMSCILADDMGLGKTAQVSSFLRALQLQYGIRGPHLIVVPLSSLTSWARELHRWAPELRVVKYHGDRASKTAAALHQHIGRHHVVYLTTPATANTDSKFFRSKIFACVIVDEAHILKNGSTNISRFTSRLRAVFRCAVTGTPIQNTPQEVANIMRFLFPALCRRSQFDASEPNAAAQCAELLRHIMLRRTKQSVELGLPPRVDEPITMVEATPVQGKLLQHLVDAASAAGNAELQGLYMHVRKVCNHPHMVTLLAAGSRARDHGGALDRLASAGIPETEEALVLCSAKMIQLDCLLQDMRRGGHRVLVFSNFTTQLDLLEGFCHLRGYSYERLDGTCNRVERELSMLRFNHPASSVFLFLVTTTAGGVGVTLTGADRVILFDAHHNPQIDRQAADRAHRIGQTRPVHVYRFCVHGTLEETVLAAAQQKAQVGDFIVDGKEGSEVGSHFFSHAELRRMFAAQARHTERPAKPGITRSAPLEETAPEPPLSSANGDNALLSQVMAALSGSSAGASEVEGGERAPRAGRPVVQETQTCFCCGGRMRPLEPLLHCSLCPKAYHAECLGLPLSEARRARWVCPRHACTECEKRQTADGALFMCASCPASFCFDCLDDRFFAMGGASSVAAADPPTSEGVTSFRYISKTYTGMEREGVAVSRERYYITCLECAGIGGTSESSSASTAPSSASSECGEAEESPRAVPDADTEIVADGEVELL